MTVSEIRGLIIRLSPSVAGFAKIIRRRVDRLIIAIWHDGGRQIGPDDVSEDVAHELRGGCDLQMRNVPFFLQRLSVRYEGSIARRPAAAAHAA